MNSKIPIIRNTNYFFYIPQLSILLLIIAVLYICGSEHYLIIGFSIYFLLSIYLKILIPKWHRKGINYVKKGDLQSAIFAFQKSYEFFQRYAWIDQYRSFTIFSTSNFSYSEMALMNIIWCFEQLGDKKNATKYHNLLKQKFPNNQYSS